MLTRGRRCNFVPDSCAALSDTAGGAQRLEWFGGRTMKARERERARLLVSILGRVVAWTVAAAAASIPHEGKKLQRSV